MRRAAGLRPPFAGVINAFALQWADMTVLVDAGADRTMGPAAGKLATNLGAAGIAPDSVTAVLMTHHAGGLTDEANIPAFANAELCLSDNGMDYWASDDARDAAPDLLKSSFDLARRRLLPMANEPSAFNAGEVLAEAQAVPLPGHTTRANWQYNRERGRKTLDLGRCDERSCRAGAAAGRVPKFF